jgi:hypothetical protein
MLGPTAMGYLQSEQIMELSFSPDEKKGGGGGGGGRGGGGRGGIGRGVTSSANRAQLPNSPKPAPAKGPNAVQRVAQVVKNTAVGTVMGALPMPAKIVAAVFKPQPAY